MVFRGVLASLLPSALGRYNEKKRRKREEKHWQEASHTAHQMNEATADEFVSRARRGKLFEQQSLNIGAAGAASYKVEGAPTACVPARETGCAPNVIPAYRESGNKVLKTFVAIVVISGAVASIVIFGLIVLVATNRGLDHSVRVAIGGFHEFVDGVVLLAVFARLVWAWYKAAPWLASKKIGRR